MMTTSFAANTDAMTVLAADRRARLLAAAGQPAHRTTAPARPGARRRFGWFRRPGHPPVVAPAATTA
jgi:hypothetical protein